jgi:hypothetical protein
MAVISLVIEAIGRMVSLFFSYSVSPLSASCTSATDERSLGPSPARAKPTLTNSTPTSAQMATIFSSKCSRRSPERMTILEDLGATSVRG